MRAGIQKINTEKWDFRKNDILRKVAAELFWKYNEKLDEQYCQLSLFEEENKKELVYFDEYIAGSNGNKLNIKAIKKERLTIYLAAPFTDVALEEKKEEGLALLWGTGRNHGVLPDVYQKQLKKQIVDKWKFKVILPHEDINDWGNRELSSDVVLRKIVEGITQSDAMVVIPGRSIGAHLEIGITIAQHKPVVFFEVEEMKNSFYVSNFDVLDGVWRYQVKSMDEISELLGKKEVLERIKKYLEA